MGGGGGMFPGGAPNRRRQQCEEIIVKLPVTLEDLYNGGKEISLPYSRVIMCGKCDGRGGKLNSAKKCMKCNGMGKKVVLQQIGIGMVRQMHTQCHDCGGKGETYSDRDRCDECNAKCTKEETKNLLVHIDKGMKDMQKIVYREEGHQLPGTEKGNVIVVLMQQDHPHFRRSGDNLVLKYDATLTEALCGFLLPVRHLDGRELLLKLEQGNVIQKETVRAVAGEGMPIYKNPFEKGNLYVQMEVTFPDNNFATPEQMKQLELLLPPRPPFAMPIGDHVEEVELSDFNPNEEDGNNRSEAYESDEEQGTIPCATQ